MKGKQLLSQIKNAVHEIEPDADVILYGSRSRDEARLESDQDFLVLVNGTVDEDRIDSIRHRLYKIEWECGEVITCIVRCREDWDSPLYKNMPFHENVEREGKIL